MRSKIDRTCIHLRVSHMPAADTASFFLKGRNMLVLLCALPFSFRLSNAVIE